MRANLSWAYLSDANLSGADLSDAILDRADLRYADLTNARWYHASLSDIRINDDTNFGVTLQRTFGNYLPWGEDEKHLTYWSRYEIDARKRLGVATLREFTENRQQKKDQLEAAAWTYRRLESLHEENAMGDQAREYNFRRGQADRKRYRTTFQPGKWAVATAHRYLTGYGNRFSWILAWILVTIFGSAILYLAFG